ncbi:MAG: hypothetical protein JSV17_18590 [Candidatus Aminicenantes bacterium]|nr:MAG: hypothetical protein JSV17_18590 [Candidatus Aminicenantes bacterium]
MISQFRLNTWYKIFLLVTIAVCIGSWGCKTAATSVGTRPVTVTSLGSRQAATRTDMTRDELEEAVRRFADRFLAQMQLALDQIGQLADTPNKRWIYRGFVKASSSTVLNIAIGPDAVTNLFDMMVLTMLMRLQIEEYWIPTEFTGEEGQGLLQTVRDLEEDIWTVADKVLLPDQKASLRVLVDDWHDKHPDQHYPWGIRFDEFSGQRAASLEKVKETGGLLRQISKTRETVEELEKFGERILFYVQRVPRIASDQAMFSLTEIFKQEEVAQLFTDVDRLNTTLERYANLGEKLPGEQFAAIDQILEGLERERAALTQDLFDKQPELQELLGELQQTFAAADQLVGNIDQLTGRFDKGDDKGEPKKQSKPMDINEVRQVIQEASLTIGGLTEFVGAVDDLMASPAWEQRIPDALKVAEELEKDINKLLNRIFLLAALLIFIFFCLLLAYRFVATRMKRQQI